MQTQYQNKQMVPDHTEAAGPNQEYHFSGGGEYEPITIEAHSQSEAHRLWIQKRKKVGEELPTNQEKGK